MFGSSTTGDDFPFLLSNQVHLWCIDYRTDTELIERCKNNLSDQEIERSQYFKFEEARSNYLISQGTLKFLLGKYLDKDPQDVVMARRSKGKPYIAEDESLFFNISNSGSRCVYAFTRIGEVGIDLEELRTLNDLDDMIEKNYTATEQRYINQVPEERAKRFFQLWTVKESYNKAIGEGMRLTPENIELRIDGGKFNLEAVRGFFDETPWNFDVVETRGPYVGTLAYQGDNVEITPMRYL